MHKYTNTISLTLLLFLALIRPVFGQANDKAGQWPEDERQPIYAVGSSSNFPPVNFLDKSGNLRGFGRELSTEVVNAMGGEAIHLYSDHWSEVVSWLKGGDVDFIHDMAYSPERSKEYQFTSPILTMDESLFVHADRFDINGLGDLVGKKIACVNGHITHQYLKQFPELYCEVVATPIEGVYLVTSKKVDTFIYPKQIGLYYIQKLGLRGKLKITGSPLRTLTWRMAVKKGNPGLVQKLENGLRKVRENGDYERIYTKYFGKSLFAGLSQNELFLIAYTVSIISLLVGGVIVLYWANRKIRKNYKNLAAIIQERNRIEMELKNSEVTASVILDTMNDGVWLVSPDFTILHANQRLSEIFGIPLENLIGAKTLPLFDEENRNLLRARMDDRRKGNTEDYEYLHHRKDGKKIWVRLSGRPLFSAKGEFKGAVALVADITEEKLKKVELEQSEKKFRHLTEGSLQGVLIQKNNHIEFCNQALANIFGYETQDEMKDLALNNIIFLEDHVRFGNAHWHNWAESHNFKPEECRGKRKDGAEIWLNILVKTVEWDNEQAVQFTLTDVTERKAWEEEIKTNRLLLKSVVDSLPISLNVKNLDDQYLLFNNYFADRHGVKAIDADKYTFTNLPKFISDNPDEIGEANRQVIQTGMSVELPYMEGNTLDNELVVQKIIKAPLRDESDEIIGVITLAEDITEKVRAQEKLDAQQRLFETVVDALPHPTYLKGLNGQYKMVNKVMAENFGMTKEEIIGLTHAELPFKFSKKNQKTMAEADAEILRTTKRVDIPIIRNVYPDGREVTQHHIKAPYFNEQGEVIGIVGQAMDISERIKTEDELRAGQNLLKTILNTLPHWVFVKDLTGRILMANKAFANDQQLTSREIIGLRADEYYPESKENQDNTFLWDKTVMDSGEGLIGLENTHFTLNGEKSIRRFSKVPVFDSEGRVTGLVTISEDITHLKNNEEALRRSRDQMKLVADNLPVLIAYTNSASVNEFANQTYANWYNKSVEDIIGKTFEEIAGPSHFKKLKPLLESVLKGNTVSNEQETSFPDGKTRLVERTYLPDIDDAGNVRGFFGLVSDITERKHREEELRLQHNLLKLVTDNIPGLVIYADKSLRYRMVNSTAGIWFNRPVEQILNKKTREILPDETFKLVNELAEKVFGGDSIHTEKYLKFPDGNSRHVDLNMVPDITEDGEVRGYVGLLMDISRRIQNEKALRESEEKHRTLTESGLHGILVHKDGKPVFANNTLFSIFGYDSMEELQELNCTDLIAPSDRDLRTRSFEIGLSEDKAQEHFEFLGLRKDGTYIWLAATVNAIEWEGQKATYIAIYNIEERKTAELKLQKAYQEQDNMQLQVVEVGKLAAMGELAAGIAHEINNPLATISSSAELMEATFGDSDIQNAHEMHHYMDNHLKKIQATVFRCKAIINSLLEFSRKDGELMALVDLLQLVAKTVDLVRTSANARNREFLVEIEDGVRKKIFSADDIEGISLQSDPDLAQLYSIRTSPQQIQQVLLNLLINAVHATDENGLITINLVEKNGGVQIGVKDDGCGIQPENLEKIFTPFFTTKSPGQGTGLGLSLCRQIIRSLNGKIVVQSKEGQGTTFEIWLPKDRGSLAIQLNN